MFRSGSDEAPVRLFPLLLHPHEASTAKSVESCAVMINGERLAELVLLAPVGEFESEHASAPVRCRQRHDKRTRCRRHPADDLFLATAECRGDRIIIEAIDVRQLRQ